MLAVFPARAGMNRGQDTITVSLRRVPRASGDDEPLEGAITGLTPVCSPRELKGRELYAAPSRQRRLSGRLQCLLHRERAQGHGGIRFVQRLAHGHEAVDLSLEANVLAGRAGS